MSDMKKWMKLAENVPPILSGKEKIPAKIKKDATVMVDPRVGGGTGRFMDYIPGGAKIDIKGVAVDLGDEEFSLPTRDYEDPYDSGNKWFHVTQDPDTIGTMNDKPEFRPGDMVEILNVYGSVIGPGVGVFVSYGTTGKDCIISFDNKQIVVPIENVGAMLEQDAKDNFKETDNDGNLSPMSLGADNVKIEQEPAMDQKDEFSKWLNKVEEALSGNLDVNMLPQEQECNCQSWNCPICFPEIEVDSAVGEVCPTCGHECGGHEDEVDLMTAELPVIDELEEVPMEEEEMEFQLERPRSGKGVKLGDIVKHPLEFRKTGGQDSPLTYGEENLDEADFDDDVNDDTDYEAMSAIAMKDLNDQINGQMEFASSSDADIDEMHSMIQKILNIQGMGFSKSDKVYSEGDFEFMSPSQLKQVYQEVTGNQPTNKGTTMENIDKDVQHWMARLKEYDQLRMSKSINESPKKEEIPAYKRKESGKDDWKVTKQDLEKGEEKNLSSKAGLEKAKKETGINENDEGKHNNASTGFKAVAKKAASEYGSKEAGERVAGAVRNKMKAAGKLEESTPDQEVLDWMARFSKLGNMKGYGR